MTLLFIAMLAVQIALVIHVMRTGRNTFWVYILLFAPVVGVAAYVVVELLPLWLGTRTARNLMTQVSDTVRPNRWVQAAEAQFEVADTVQNAMRLADQYLEKGRFEDAKALYLRSRTGIHADDPLLFVGLAKAQFGLTDYAGVLTTLDELKRARPDAANADNHLLYARATEGLGRMSEACEEYEALIKYYPGPEAACRLASLYASLGNKQRAKDLYQGVLNQARISGRHYKTLHREWVQAAERGVKD